MATFDGFKATLGISLMEGAAFTPWTPALPGGPEGVRGWQVEVEGLRGVACVLDAADLAPDLLDERITRWRAGVAAHSVSEAVLLVGNSPPGWVPVRPAGDPWQVWRVDLVEGTLVGDRPAALPASPFEALMEAAVRGAFEGPPLSVADLVEEERGRLAGRIPFTAFLAGQSVVGAHVLLGAILLVFLGATWLTLGVERVDLRAWPPEVGAIWSALKRTSPAALVWLGATIRPLVEQGEVWRLLAANYLHAGLLHLFVNAYSLYALGPTLEKIFGTTRFLAIWTIAGGVGAAASVAFNPHGLSVGASGALFGLLGAMLVLATRFRGAIPRHQTRTMRDVSLITLGINVILGATIPHIDNFAHLGGLVGGSLAALALGPHPALRPGHGTPRWLPALWALPALAVVSLGCGVAAVWGERFPRVEVVDAAGGYRLTLPVGIPFERLRPGLLLVSPEAAGRVRIDSLPQGPGGLNPPVTVEALRGRPGEVLARVIGPHERLVGTPLVARYGRRLVVSGEVERAGGGRELLALTLGASRLLVVRSEGVERDPWVRAMQEHVREHLMPEPAP